MTKAYFSIYCNLIGNRPMIYIRQRLSLNIEGLRSMAYMNLFNRRRSMKIVISVTKKTHKFKMVEGIEDERGTRSQES